ncbi:MAG: amidohydrolase [Desulfobacterales bacterium]|uniref:Amidohydrolase n=1 Tax=Candidatus Desulfatibia profunda TaxID=2841695 RepID=A0A8J6NM89_9BACT|nr:amidohydrolase [Candidatus Desulfatibia profunda]MBL7178660.1 amidohydrolase [Desulfobacterales bacterium]
MPGRLPENFNNWLVEVRRWFHRFPEPAYREEKTAVRICEILDSFGVPFQTGVGKTGVVATLSARRSGAVVAFRSDMDALPLEEANEVPYKSQHPGCMHACGHDGHITIALGVIRWLVERNWPQKGCGTILFIFQPAEEGGAGAKAMLESGIFDTLPVQAVFAGHMYPELPVGNIGIAPEISNAATNSISIRLKGRGGHGAHPHQCIDPIVAGAYLVTQLQTLISRELPPLESAVLTIGRFEAGTASNIIPEEAVLEGTLRTLRPEIREKMITRLQQMVKGVELSHNVNATLQLAPGYPVLINDSKLVKHTRDVAAEVLGADHVHSLLPRMGAEDFAYFCEKWGGIMVGLGCHDPKQGMQHGLHSPHFDFDETVLEVGTRLFGNILTRYLEKFPVRPDLGS